MIFYYLINISLVLLYETSVPIFRNFFLIKNSKNQRLLNSLDDYIISIIRRKLNYEITIHYSRVIFLARGKPLAKVLIIDDFIPNNFSCSIGNVVHCCNPRHHIFGFKCLGDALVFHCIFLQLIKNRFNC